MTDIFHLLLLSKRPSSHILPGHLSDGIDDEDVGDPENHLDTKEDTLEDILQQHSDTTNSAGDERQEDKNQDDCQGAEDDGKPVNLFSISRVSLVDIGSSGNGVIGEADGISLQTIVESHIDELKIEDQISLGDVDVLSMITYPVVIRITRETLKRPVGIGKTEIVGETIDVSCGVLG